MTKCIKHSWHLSQLTTKLENFVRAQKHQFHRVLAGRRASFGQDWRVFRLVLPSSCMNFTSLRWHQQPPWHKSLHNSLCLQLQLGSWETFLDLRFSSPSIFLFPTGGIYVSTITPWFYSSASHLHPLAQATGTGEFYALFLQRRFLNYLHICSSVPAAATLEGAAPFPSETYLLACHTTTASQQPLKKKSLSNSTSCT